MTYIFFVSESVKFFCPGNNILLKSVYINWLAVYSNWLSSIAAKLKAKDSYFRE